MTSETPEFRHSGAILGGDRVTLRRAHASELTTLHAILADCVTWLQAKGVSQWTRPYPLERYRKDLASGRVHACQCAGALVGTVTLHDAAPDYYAA
ncbi:MAG TPA: hypothetical protein VGI10_23650 [Polyangiaceae bacterium]